MTERSSADYKWSIGNCSLSQKWQGTGTYTEKCCLSDGRHIFTCRTSRNKNDWSSNVVTMMGQRFCNDFVGYEASIEVNVSGPLMYIHI